jgi:hypothetical protein
MRLRFLIDEDTPVALAEELRSSGHDAVHSRDGRGEQRAEGDKQWKYSRKMITR